MRKRAALLMVLWLAMLVGTLSEDQNAENSDSWTGWARDKLTEGLGLKGGEAGSKSAERANKAAFVQKFLEGAIYSLEKHQTAKAEELMKGAMEFLYHDNTIKDKAAKLEELMKEAIKYLEQDMVEKAENVVKGAVLYLKGDDEDNNEEKGKRVTYLEKDKVAAGVNKASLVDSFLQGALTYLEQRQVAKAIDIVQGIVLYVGQSDEIKDKAGAAEEMIQLALTYLEADKLEKGTEMIREAAKVLENDEDFKAAIGKGKGAKYLEKGNAEIGLQKAHFVEEVLKGAMSYLQANSLVKAKDVIQGVQQFIAQDNTLKDKRATAEQLLNGAFSYLEEEKSEKALKIIQEAIEYLESDEDVKAANKVFKEAEAKAAKATGGKHSKTNNGAKHDGSEL